jgi:hypothetical protein
VQETNGRGQVPRFPRTSLLSRTALAAALAALALAPLACKKTRPDEPDGPAQVILSVTQAPANVGCLGITIASDHAERRSFDVGPGKPTSFTLRQLSIGVAVFSVDAFTTDCAAVLPTSAPALTGGPVSVTLNQGANGTVIIQLEPSSDGTLNAGFDPNAAPTCSAGGSACKADGECCSHRCSPATPSSAERLCRADEPPTPAAFNPAAWPQYQPKLLEDVGARASYPAFDGDMLFVAFPRVLDDRREDTTADVVRARYVLPAVRAAGFAPTDRLVSPKGPVQKLPGGDFAALAQTACEDDGGDPTSKTLCGYLAALGQGQVPGNVAAFVSETLGMPAERLRDEINTPLNYWFFSQRDRGVPIEHKGVMAIQHGDGRRISSVFGSVLANTRIVNQVGLNPATALQRAQAVLIKVEGLLDGKAPALPRDEPQLVLLPYGAPPDDPKGAPSGATALRFAYRSRLGGTRAVAGSNQQQVVSYLVWADAANGDLLKYASESGNATGPYSRTFSPWCRDPSEALSSCGVSLTVNDTPLGSGAYTLSNSNLELSYPGLVPTPLPDSLFSAPAVNERCNPLPRFRAASAFAQLERVRKTIQTGGKFTPFATPVKVALDDLGVQDWASYNPPALTFIQGALNGAATPATTDCTVTAGTRLNGAQDSTILAHEYAHLVTLQLQNGNPSNYCGEAACPLLNPYNRLFFHDYSDGFAALLAESPCIGGWTAKNTSANKVGTGGPTSRDEMARACGDSQEGFLLPRLLFADPTPDLTFSATAAFDAGAATAVTAATSGGFLPPIRTDAFPTHRAGINGSPGEYGDGQIVGAALWHLWQGVKSQARLTGGLPIWGRINEAVWSTGFSTTICPFTDSTCDINIYRAGREMLLHLTDAWLAGDGSQSLNKLLSAFARAGLFLIPPTCLEGSFADPTPPLDPQFCPTFKQGADAIVDIDDGDATAADFTEKLGIRFADDDFVKSGSPPKFRIWTGPAFAFTIGAGTTTVPPPKVLCNDHFQVYVRARGATTWTPDAAGTTGPLGPCYAEAPMITTALVTIDPAVTFATVEYKVVTWRDATPTPASQRDSMEPGAGLWSTPATMPAFAIKPSAFFVTATGRAPM